VKKSSPSKPAPLIQANLRLRGIKIKDMARALGVSPAAVCRVIVGKTQSARIKAHIAQTIGVPKESLWPQK
jgi:lambda repressor-like predicted transcriptional regulator